MRGLIIASKKSTGIKAILEEAKKLQLDINFAAIQNLQINNIKEEIEITNEGRNILDYDIFLFRGLDPFFNLGQNVAIWLKKNGKVIIDEKLASEIYIPDKVFTFFQCANNNIPYPKTIIANVDAIINGCEINIKYPIIAKDPLGAHGDGIYLINDQKELKAIIEKISFKQVILQERLTDKKEDYRVFVIGNKSFGIMKKMATGEEFRTNVAKGGQISYLRDEELEKLGLKAAQLSNTEIAGVDIMMNNQGKAYILEINRTPQFNGFVEVSKINIAKEILLYAKSKYEQKI